MALTSVDIGGIAVDEVELFHDRKAGIVHGGVVALPLITVDGTVTVVLVAAIEIVLVSGFWSKVAITSGDIFNSFFLDFAISRAAGARGAVVITS